MDDTTTPAPAPTTDDIFLKMQGILNEIRPAVQMDGGDIELVKVVPEDGEVHIRMAGACVGCPASAMTLKAGIEQAIQETFPDFEVIPVA